MVMNRRWRQVGMAVPLVLLVILLVGGSLFASAFLVTLEARAARSSLVALEARQRSEGALALALEAVLIGPMPSTGGEFGPWPAEGLPAVRVEPLAGPVDSTYRLIVVAEVAGAASGRELVVNISGAASDAATLGVWLRR